MASHVLARPASSSRVEPEAGYFPLCRVCHYSFSLFVILIAELSSDTTDDTRDATREARGDTGLPAASSSRARDRRRPGRRRRERARACESVYSKLYRPIFFVKN